MRPRVVLAFLVLATLSLASTFVCMSAPFASGIREPGPHAIAVAQAEPDPADLYSVRAGLQIERFATGLALPVNVAVSPAAGSDPNAPFLYVTELYGRVRVVTKDGTVSTYAEGLLNYDPSAPFPGSGELGVTGIVVDPLTNHVLVSLVYRDGAQFMNRVLSLESSADGMSAEGQQVLIAGIPAADSHQIQALTIGPDGKLYVNVGDGHESSAAQDHADLRGKILRLNLDGSIPDDNPTLRSPVYAKGFRNPFGAAWHPIQPRLYVSDNGPRHGDRLVRVAPGGNYGWCCNLSLDALYVFDRDDVISPTAIAFDRDHLLTPEGETHLFVSVSGPTYFEGALASGKKILDVQLDDNGEVEELTEVLRYVGCGRSSVIGLAFGPDGLYFSDLYGDDGFDRDPVEANIYRVSPAPASATTPALTPARTPCGTTMPQPSPTAAPTITATPTLTPLATPTSAATVPPAPSPTITPSPTSPANGLVGDASCDGIVNSPDALLVLQFDARLLERLPCPENADVNGDDRIDSLDASLVLQVDAGLIGFLAAA